MFEIISNQKVKEYLQWLLVSVWLHFKNVQQLPYCLVDPHYLADIISFIAFSLNVWSSDVLATWLCFKMSLLPPSSLLNLCKFSPSQLDHPVYHYIVPIPHPTSTLLVFFILLSFFPWHMLHSNIHMPHTSYFHLVSTLQNANFTDRSFAWCLLWSILRPRTVPGTLWIFFK